MSFFGKLKERLFRTSSRIGEGVEAIVGDGQAAPPADGAAAEGGAADRAAPAGPAAAPRSGLFRRREEEPRRALDDAMLESLEELLISADLGVETALKVVARMAEGRMGRRMSSAEIRRALADEIARILEPVARPLPLYPLKPQVVLVVGVNGSGKTTTIGKLASQFRATGRKVIIAAGDTFRAAAVEQLQVWGRARRGSGADRAAGRGPRQPRL